MIGSPDFSQPPAVEYFFLNCIPYKARCAFRFFLCFNTAMAEANRRGVLW